MDTEGLDATAAATPATFWEERYAGSGPVWSGGANRTMVDVAEALEPGRALDLGCGEGADAIWLAGHGWTVTGLEISPTAVQRARAAARAAGLGPERLRFAAAGLDGWAGAERYDLVTACFLQPPVALTRTDVLRRAARRVTPGGQLLAVSHAAPPPWSRGGHAHEHRFLSPEEEVGELALDSGDWTTVLGETRTRPATGPDGEAATSTTRSCSSGAVGLTRASGLTGRVPRAARPCPPPVTRPS